MKKDQTVKQVVNIGHLQEIKSLKYWDQSDIHWLICFWSIMHQGSQVPSEDLTGLEP